MKALRALFVAGALVSLLLAPRPAAAAPSGEPRIRDLSIVYDGGQVLASFRLDGGFTPHVLDRIESGLPTTLAYELELDRDRKRWWDDSLDSTRLEVVAMFNAVTREYLVNTKLGGKLIDSETLHDPGDLERAMTRFTALPVFPLQHPDAHERYLLRVRVELGMGHVIYFVPVLHTTDWVESNKIRVRNP
jgi:hypothetical protein